MDSENKFTSTFSLKERDGWPISKYNLHGKKHFAGVFCADHVAATEFVIGATLVTIGANAFDILIGLLIGNLLAVLSWTFITAPIAVKTRLSLYAYIKKIAGNNTILLFNALNIVMFAVFTGTMITVSGSSLRVVLNIPTQLGWYPQDLNFVLLILATGAFVITIAFFGFNAIAKFSIISVPWMVCMFVVGALASLPFLAYHVIGTTEVTSLRDFFNIIDQGVWTGSDSGKPGIGLIEIIGFAWAANATLHFGLVDMALLRFAPKFQYGLFSSFGMYLGHYVCWICAGIMGASSALILKTTLIKLDPGDVGFSTLGVTGIFTVLAAGLTTAIPLLYRAGLAAVAVFHKSSRKQTTLILGVITTIIACFPFVFTTMMQLLTYAGIIIVPIGAIVFAEHWVFPKINLTQFWAYYGKTGRNNASIIAWLGSLAFGFSLNSLNIIPYYYLFLPTWTFSLVLYTVLAYFSGARNNYPESEQQEKQLLKEIELVQEAEKEPGSTEISRKQSYLNLNLKILINTLTVTSWGCLGFILYMAVYTFMSPDIQVYQPRFQFFHKAILIASFFYFVFEIIKLWIRNKVDEKPVFRA
jgi:NCS1 family nucleobase:cation symporter-1